MDILPLHPLFAAEVTGLDLAGPIDVPTLEVLHDAFLEHAVLLFRSQRLSAAAQAGFATRFAALEAPLLDRMSVLLPPALRVITGNPPGEAPPPDTAWHADHTHDSEPSLACFVHATSAGAPAGDLAFADQRAALAGLPAALRHRAEELRAEHRHAGHLAEHPVVRSHPVTGEASLAGLFAAATAPRVCWRHRLEPGDLLLWDNRAVLHTGTPAAALQQTRIEGDRPLGTRALEMPWVVAG
jgi:taurine dioxygenase